MNYSWLLPIAAFLLDCALGDPYYPFHPARIAGALASRLETFSRRMLGPTISSGAAAWAAIVGLFVLAGVTLPIAAATLAQRLSAIIFPGLASEPIYRAIHVLAEILLIYACIAPKDLALHAARVAKALLSSTKSPEERLAKAREAVSMIVGRDVQRLDEKGVIKATVESVAESAIDGVIAPLFWAFVAGAPGALAYRAINTLDSLWGHRDQRYEKFGKFAARADDAATWLPARLGFLAALLALAPLSIASPRSYRLRDALVLGWRDKGKHASPNSAWLEALFAGALGLMLAGPAWYSGELLPKPYLGEARRAPEVADIHRAIILMYSLSIAFLIVGSAISIIAA
jgi:adenosylcobinamide-phosphate synthase